MGAGEARRLRFGRDSRIRQGRDFRRVRERGRRVVHGCMIANWLPHAEAPRSRLGVVTSAKIGDAVQRNRARRLLRQAFRVHQHEFAGPADLVLIARRSIVEMGYTDVEKDFLTTMRKAGLLK